MILSHFLALYANKHNTVEHISIPVNFQWDKATTNNLTNYQLCARCEITNPRHLWDSRAVWCHECHMDGLSWQTWIFTVNKISTHKKWQILCSLSASPYTTDSPKTSSSRCSCVRRLSNTTSVFCLVQSAAWTKLHSVRTDTWMTETPFSWLQYF